MGIGNIGIPSLILIVIIALLIFGPKKLPEFGKAAGETLKGFKESINGLVSDEEEEEEEEKRVEEPVKDKEKDIE